MTFFHKMSGEGAQTLIRGERLTYKSKDNKRMVHAPKMARDRIFSDLC